MPNPARQDSVPPPPETQSATQSLWPSGRYFIVEPISIDVGASIVESTTVLTLENCAFQFLSGHSANNDSAAFPAAEIWHVVLAKKADGSFSNPFNNRAGVFGRLWNRAQVYLFFLACHLRLALMRRLIRLLSADD